MISDKFWRACENGIFHIIQKVIENSPDCVNSFDCKDRTPVYVCCENNQVEILQYLIKKGADVNELCGFNGTALHIACRKVFIEIVKILVEANADIHSVILNGCTVLHYACVDGQFDVIKYIVSNGVDINHLDENGSTALSYICQNKLELYEIIAYLINHGADVNLVGLKKPSPLYYTIRSEFIESTKLLLDKGAKLSMRTSECTSPLFLSCSLPSKSIEMTTLLLSKGFEVNIFNNEYKSPLYIAYETRNYSLIKLLLDQGAYQWYYSRQCHNAHNSYYYSGSKAFDIQNSIIHNICAEGAIELLELFLQYQPVQNLLNGEMMTPIMIAIRDYQVDIIQYLLNLESEIQLDIVDYVGMSALNYACNIIGRRMMHCSEQDVIRLVDLLISKGAPVNNPDEQKSSLHIACEIHCLLLVRILLKYGADVNSAAKSGESPLHSIYNYHVITDKALEISKELIAHGANVNQSSCISFETPFHCASSYGDIKLMECLISNGADIDACNMYGENALHLAVKSGVYDKVEYLLAHGINMNAVEMSNFNTPLHFAVLSQKTELIKLLCDYGADLSVKNSDDMTVLEICEEYDFDVEKRLIERAIENADRYILK
jgi:ankyrin repeat protein